MMLGNQGCSLSDVTDNYRTFSWGYLLVDVGMHFDFLDFVSFIDFFMISDTMIRFSYVEK